MSLQVRNLDYQIGGKSILEQICLEVKDGEFVGLIGPNGCGKSTLAKHFNAILLPESGTVLVEGMDTKDEDKIYDIRQTVGMVFQSPDNQIVATVVEEDVAFALENLGVPVLVERSSYEADPLGRMEWIKLYGILTGKEELAKSLFSKEMENLKNVIVIKDFAGKEQQDAAN